MRLNEPDFSVQFCQLSLSSPLVLITLRNCKDNCKLVSITFNAFVSCSQKINGCLIQFYTGLIQMDSGLFNGA